MSTEKQGARPAGERAIVHSHLSGEDQDDLVWFFGKGQCTFERSVFGAQLELAEIFTFGSRLCPRCGGDGFRGDPERQIRDAIARVNAMTPRELERLRDAMRNGRMPSWYDDGRCRFCDGCGWVPLHRKHRRGGELTAQPVVGELRPVPKEPQSDELERYGFVSDQLQRMDDQHIQTLAAFFGAAGSRNEHDKDRGRIFGVYALTPAGKKLLKMAGKEGDLTPPLRIENQATLELTQRKQNRAALLEAAREQAEKRLRAAEQQWAEHRPRSGRRRVRGPRRVETVTDVRLAAKRTSESFRGWVDAAEETLCAV